MFKLPVRKKKTVVAAIEQKITQEERVGSPEKGILRLIKFWEQSKENLASYPEGENGLKQWMMQNAEAVTENGAIDFSKLSLTYSNKKLPFIKFEENGNVVKISISTDTTQRERNDTREFAVPNAGSRNLETLELVALSAITGFVIVSLQNGKYLTKTVLDEEQLNKIKDGLDVDVEFQNPSEIISCYALTESGPTVVSRRWRIRHWHIEERTESGNWTPIWP